MSFFGIFSDKKEIVQAADPSKPQDQQNWFLPWLGGDENNAAILKRVKSSKSYLSTNLKVTRNKRSLLTDDCEIIEKEKVNNGSSYFQRKETKKAGLVGPDEKQN